MKRMIKMERINFFEIIFDSFFTGAFCIIAIFAFAINNLFIVFFSVAIFLMLGYRSIRNVQN